jgi:hypothetical protein
MREYDAFAAMISDLRNPPTLSSHFMKYNATLNAQWRVLTEKIALSRSGCTDFLSGATAFKSHGAVSFGSIPYNPIGNTLSGVAAPMGIEYMYAMCDLDGMIRIVELELQAGLQHVNDEQLAQFALSGGARYANPFTGQPMHVDVVRKSIDFQPLAQRDRAFFPWPLERTRGEGMEAR